MLRIQRLNSLHRRVGKILHPDPKLSTDEKLKSLDILPLKTHLLFNKCIFMFKLSINNVPNYMTDFFKKSETHFGELYGLYVIPLPRIDKYKYSLSFSGSHLWNKLPIPIKSLPSLAMFKQELHKRLLSKEIVFK